MKNLTRQFEFLIFIFFFISQSTLNSALANENLSWLSPIINTLLLDEEPVSPDAICTQAAPFVHIINIGKDDVSGNPTCKDNNDVLQCVKDRLLDVLPENCRSNIDVFVPGTNQEDGKWQQFNSLVDGEDNRAAVSLNYVTGANDGLRYDDGVISIFDRLPILLQAIKEEFTENNVRVYGHSKGSHGLALVADYILEQDGYEKFYFYAFGQAKRTAIDISGRFDVKAGRKGDKGYIQKLSDNLVGITWSNDEVHFYEGSSFSGLAVPPRWLHAGRVKDSGTGSIATPINSRIDHHDTYGGNFIKRDSLPYCATGRWSFMNVTVPDFYAQCNRRDEAFVPYFWGQQDCRDISWNMLESDDQSAPTRVWIGSSGPRTDGCKEDLTTISASYELAYRYNRADQQCKYNLEIKFEGLNGRPGGSTIKTSASNGNTFERKIKRGNIRIPPHMNLKIAAKLTEQNTEGPIGIRFKCEKEFVETESYIDYLNVTFRLPTTGRTRTLSLIGNRETSHYPIGTVTNKNLSGWLKSGGEWNLEYDTILNNLKIEGETSATANGTFTKIIHLID